jgi:hypothetical protein
MATGREVPIFSYDTMNLVCIQMSKFSLNQQFQRPIWLTMAQNCVTQEAEHDKLFDCHSKTLS